MPEDLPDVEHAPDLDPWPPGGHAAGLELDAPDGPRLLGPPTVDSDDDGRPDTTVDLDGSGLLELATDLDGDARVDVLTTIDAAGVAHTVELAPPVHGWSSWDEGIPPPAPVLDPANGQWSRSTD